MNCKYLVTGLLSLLSVVIALLWFLGFYEEKICVMQEGLYGSHSRQNREQNEFLNIPSTGTDQLVLDKPTSLGQVRGERGRSLIFSSCTGRYQDLGNQSAGYKLGVGLMGESSLLLTLFLFYSTAIKQSVGGSQTTCTTKSPCGFYDSNYLQELSGNGSYPEFGDFGTREKLYNQDRRR